MRRLVVVGGLAAALLMVGGVAAAKVTFTDNARSEFQVDENGNPTTGGSRTLMSDAWRLFFAAPEGQRIFTFSSDVDTEFIIDVLPEDQVGGGDALGTAQVIERNDAGIPTKIRLKIRNENVFLASSVADTIWHEFRHGEIFIFGNSDGDHDALDGHTDDTNLKFRKDVERAETTLVSTTVDRNPPTPIHDAIMGDARQRDALRRAAFFFGDLLDDIRDSISFNEPTIQFGYIDIESYGSFKMGYTIEGVDLTYNKSAFECGDREGSRIVVCSGDGVLDVAPGEVLTGFMMMREPIPLSGDVSLIYSMVVDSDRDAANDWVFVPPFDWDQFQGTDRWYQLIYDHRTDTWSLIVTQLLPDGSQSRVGEASSARVVVEGDVVVFFVSMDEFPHRRPGVRLTSFGHDGFFSESFRGMDVSGEDPTQPPQRVSAEVLETD